jgi:dihydroorotate dehydrogenase
VVVRRIDGYERFVRPVAFRLDPERSHSLVRPYLALHRGGARARRAVSSPLLRSTVAGLALRNPIGLAAGFDKNARMFDRIGELGFGYVTVGTIVPAPRTGNPRPRVIRYPDENALGNCMGLPSDGLQVVAARLSRRRNRATPLIGNIEGPAVDDYLRCHAAIAPWVDAIEVSLRCPNVIDADTDVTSPAGFERLMQALGSRCEHPFFVKIPTYDSESERAERMELADIAKRYGASGVTIAGSFVRDEPRLSIGRGNVSGAPALSRNLRFVSDLHDLFDGQLAIKSLGGIATGHDAYRAIAAGASTVELLTAFVYRGPAVAVKIAEELTSILEREGVSSLDELRGTAPATTADDA